MTTVLQYPAKTRDIHNHHMDSTVWDSFTFRDDDIVIATYGKSGTTWTQQIIGQLIFNGAEDVPVSELSPWLDLRVSPKEVKLSALEAQTNRRFVKTHLPVDALVFSPRAKYLYIGRDGRDAVWSLYNHHANASPLWYQVLNETPGLVGSPIDPPGLPVEDYFMRWLEQDGYPFWPFWENIRSWWAIRDLPNVKLLHFNDLKADLPGQVKGIAEFLGIAVGTDCLARIVEHCSFDYMKAHADKAAPLGGALWEGGGKTFINKGTNGRWRDRLTSEQCARYETKALAELGPDCAQWLAQGAKMNGR